MSEMVERVAMRLWAERQEIARNEKIPLDNWEDENELLRANVRKEARGVIETMRVVPEVCYDNYRCDKMWRDLNSTEVWNLWLDAALHE